MPRHITIFRNETNPLQWDFHISENQHELEQVMGNIKRRGVKHYATYQLGPQVDEFSRRIGETNDG